MSNTKTEAQRLADQLTKWANDYATTDDTDSMARQAAAELRRLDAENQQLQAQLAKAVAEEREACAKVAQDYSCQVGDAPWECAAAIRARRTP